MKLRVHHGFSLLEVLIAVGILAGAVVTLMGWTELSTRLSTDDEKLLQGVVLAKNKMVELERDINKDMAKGLFPEEKIETGIFPEPYEKYIWEYSIKKVEIPVADSSGEGESAIVAGALKNVMKEISKAVREVKLTVYWDIDDDDEKRENAKKFTITTHIVNMQ